jgi:hypothetical protein
MIAGCMRCVSAPLRKLGRVLLKKLLWLSWLSLMLCASAIAETRIYLATMAPGALYFERFGHNAIVLHDSLAPASQNSVAFNFGYFDFNSKNFLSNFVLGRMAYLGVALNAEADLQNYVSHGRSVWLQELRLTEAQKSKLIARLRNETTEPNDVYRYDYFRANCSTKVRDALNDALDGAIEAAFRDRSHGYTYRSLGLAHAADPLWLYVGIHAGLGPSTDQPLSIYQEMFIPAALQQALSTMEITGPDGARQKLVRATQTYGEVQENKLPPLPDWRWRFLVAGLALAILIAAGTRFQGQYFLRRLGAMLATLSALTFGLGGLLLVFLWMATDHQDAYRNLNLSLFSPLWLACVPTLILSARERGVRAGRLSVWAANIALSIAVLGIAIKVLPNMKQVNIEWVLFAAPIILALHFTIRTIQQSDSPR